MGHSCQIPPYSNSPNLQVKWDDHGFKSLRHFLCVLLKMTVHVFMVYDSTDLSYYCSKWSKNKLWIDILSVARVLLKFEGKLGKWNFCPPGMVRLATALHSTRKDSKTAHQCHQHGPIGNFYPSLTLKCLRQVLEIIVTKPSFFIPR